MLYYSQKQISDSTDMTREKAGKLIGERFIEISCTKRTKSYKFYLDLEELSKKVFDVELSVINGVVSSLKQAVKDSLSEQS